MLVLAPQVLQMPRVLVPQVRGPQVRLVPPVLLLPQALLVLRLLRVLLVLQKLLVLLA